MGEREKTRSRQNIGWGLIKKKVCCRVEQIVWGGYQNLIFRRVQYSLLRPMNHYHESMTSTKSSSNDKAFIFSLSFDRLDLDSEKFIGTYNIHTLL